jgi:hypothetical protein
VEESVTINLNQNTNNHRTDNIAYGTMQLCECGEGTMQVMIESELSLPESE